MRWTIGFRWGCHQDLSVGQWCFAVGVYVVDVVVLFSRWVVLSYVFWCLVPSVCCVCGCGVRSPGTVVHLCLVLRCVFYLFRVWSWCVVGFRVGWFVGDGRYSIRWLV